MFTGLIEGVGRVRRIARGAGATRLAIETGEDMRRWEDGESVAVDGVCLTVARRAGTVFEADAVAETLSRTTLGTLRVDEPVHLERALAVGGRLGGHLVQGHVDAVVKVISWVRRAADVRLTVTLPPALAGLIATKGSVALHGVSLTVASVTARRFAVALIPETLERTKLGRLRPGDGLNLEVDLIARYLEALMRGRKR